jgi:hypothetical protein
MERFGFAAPRTKGPDVDVELGSDSIVSDDFLYGNDKYDNNGNLEINYDLFNESSISSQPKSSSVLNEEPEEVIIEDTLKGTSKDIAYVIITMHSTLTDNLKPTKISKTTQKLKRKSQFDMYKMPEAYNVFKITAAANGEFSPLHNDLIIQVRQLAIQGIKDYATQRKTNRAIFQNEIKTYEVLMDKSPDFIKALDIAIQIQSYLQNRDLTSNAIKIYNLTLSERYSLSLNKRVLNKQLIPMTINADSKITGNDFDKFAGIRLMAHVNNNTELIDINLDKEVLEYAKTKKHTDIEMRDIIEYVCGVLEYKNLVLIDLSCSAPKSDKNPIPPELIKYLNDNGIHGGKPKRTKKYKKKKTRKTRKQKKRKNNKK